MFVSQNILGKRKENVLIAFQVNAFFSSLGSCLINNIFLSNVVRMCWRWSQWLWPSCLYFEIRYVCTFFFISVSRILLGSSSSPQQPAWSGALHKCWYKGLDSCCILCHTLLFYWYFNSNHSDGFMKECSFTLCFVVLMLTQTAALCRQLLSWTVFQEPAASCFVL